MPLYGIDTIIGQSIVFLVGKDGMFLFIRFLLWRKTKRGYMIHTKGFMTYIIIIFEI